MKTYMANRRLARRTKLLQLSNNRCCKCGSDDNLEFDHIDKTTKKFTLSGCGLDKSWNSILEEHKKCQLLCRDCHKQKTTESKDHVGGHNKNTSPYVHGTLRSYFEIKCRCERCKKAKALSRKQYVKYTQVID